MTSYCSLLYLLIFLPGVVLAYSLAPRRLRWLVLLGGSYAFFWELSGKLLIFLLISTGIVYLAALRLSALRGECGRLGKELPKAERKKLEIEHFVEGIPDPELRLIFRYRFLDGMKLSDIGDKLMMDRSNVGKKINAFLKLSHNSHF